MEHHETEKTFVLDSMSNADRIRGIGTNLPPGWLDVIDPDPAIDPEEYERVLGGFKTQFNFKPLISTPYATRFSCPVDEEGKPILIDVEGGLGAKRAREFASELEKHLFPTDGTTE